MPRPKRTKIGARAVPRVDETTQPPPKPTRPTRKPRPGKDVVESYSEDSDGLVFKRARPRTPIRIPGQPEVSDSELVMTGALPAPEAQADAEKSAEAVSEQKTRSSKRRTSSRTPANTKNRRSLGRPSRMQEADTSLPVAGAAQDDESSLLDPSLLTFGSLDSDSPAHGTCPPSTIRVGGTPAHETSILALTNFRRRPRQPSLLRMVHQTTEVEGADADSGDEGDDLDDFRPDDESTPLRIRNNQAAAQLNETSELSIASSGSRGTKRKRLSIIQVPRSSPPVEPAAPAERAESPRSSSPSLPEGVAQSQEDDARQEPVILSETMAPPRSSSPVEDVEDSAGEKAVSKKTDKKEAAAGRGRPRKQTAKAQAISTERLQALLPRRRTRATRERDEYDLDTSSVEEQLASLDTDEDELQLPASRARKGTSKAKPEATRGTKKANAAKADGKRSTRTYTRRTSSDKENGSTFLTTGESAISSESSEAPAHIAAPSSTLAAIAKRFQDVDAWEMKFEEVDVGGMSSSPWR